MLQRKPGGDSEIQKVISVYGIQLLQYGLLDPFNLPGMACLYIFVPYGIGFEIVNTIPVV